jgi:hypothetical protein
MKKRRGGSGDSGRISVQPASADNTRDGSNVPVFPRRQQTPDPNFVPSYGPEKARLGGKPARRSHEVEPDNSVPVSDMNCGSSCAAQPTNQTPLPRPFLNSLSNSGTIARQVPLCLLSSIGGRSPQSRRFELVERATLLGVLVMPIGR